MAHFAYIANICSIILVSQSLAEWIEIPYMKPTREVSTKRSMIFSVVNDRILSNNSSITIKPHKTSVKEVFGTYGEIQTQISEPTDLIKSYFEIEGKSHDQMGPKFSNETSTKKSKTENNSTGYYAFLSLLKTVQNNLMKNAHKTMKSKIQVLTNLRDNLLVNIDERLRQLWPIDKTSETREYGDESHVHFPSNEGALITIGFLTLAVFLVKLVLQVIHIIKTKKMHFNTTGSAATFTTFGKKKRSVSPDDDTFKILQLIENYDFSP